MNKTHPVHLEKNAEANAVARDRWMAAGIQSLEVGNKQAARDAFLRCLELAPQHFDALHLAGVLTAELGDPQKGLVLLDAAQELGGRASPYFSNNYGNVLLAVGDFAKAEDAFERALVLLPAYPEALSNKANLLLQQDRNEEALALYDQALALQPHFADAWANRGLALRALGELPAAQESLAQALALQPNVPGYHCICAGLCIEQHRYEEALRYLDKTLALDAQYGPAYFELGNIQMHSEQYLEAKKNYLSTLRLNGASPVDLYANLAICAYNLLDTAGVDKYLDKRFELVSDFRGRWLHAMTRVPICPETPVQAAEARKLFKRELLMLKDWLLKNGVADFWKFVGDGVSNFYHVYHETDDKALLQTYASVVEMLMEPVQKELAQAKQAKLESRVEGKLRVGIVSANVRDHSVWRDRMLGLYLYKPDDVDLYTFSLGIEGSAQRAIAETSSVFYMNEASQLLSLAKKIQECELDIIYYPELGLSPTVYKLASLRLAPIQLTSWGHPITSGIKNVDYYIGNQFLDGDTGKDFYSEQLIISRSFPTYFPSLDAAREDLASHFPQLDFSKKLLLAPGSAFKYQFDFYRIYADIVQALDGVQIVFFEYDNIIFERNKKKLIEEFSQRGIDLDKLVFMGWLDQKKYRYLQEKSYLMLDSLGFSGINTALQALNAGLPVVTQRGKYLRSRLGSGVLDAAGMGKWVVETPENYVRLVCDLVQKPDLYAAYREDLHHAGGILFNNRACIDEFFEIFRSLHRSRTVGDAASTQ